MVITCFGDPLRPPIHRYMNLCDRISLAHFGIKEIIDKLLQAQSSYDCGLYCIYFAHYIFSSCYPEVTFVREKELKRFMKHILWKFIIENSKHSTPLFHSSFFSPVFTSSFISEVIQFQYSFYFAFHEKNRYNNELTKSKIKTKKTETLKTFTKDYSSI